jgi:phospholipase C
VLTRQDLAFYYALADAYTVCDSYFCPVLGATDPNRVMGISGTIDPDGKAGGPFLETAVLDRLSQFGKLRWETMPQRLQAAGVSWKWLTGALPAAATGIAGPIGLGFRVPCLVVSPFSRGGHLCPDLFDHTSLLRFIETRFGVEVPNLSAWRRSVTGDMTSALALARPPDTQVPSLPEASLGDVKVAEQAVLNAIAGSLDAGIPYPTRRRTPCRPRSQARPARQKRAIGRDHYRRVMAACRCEYAVLRPGRMARIE